MLSETPFSFAGLANRLTSLLAGILATLLLWKFFGLAFPDIADWVAVLFVLIAVYYMRKAEVMRMAEDSRATDEKARPRTA